MSSPFDSVKVFSATTDAGCENLGADVDAWLAANLAFVAVERVVTSSSDAAFRCVSITVFYRSR